MIETSGLKYYVGENPELSPRNYLINNNIPSCNNDDFKVENCHHFHCNIRSAAFAKHIVNCA